MTSQVSSFTEVAYDGPVPEGSFEFVARVMFD
jgi:hypothetical protein